MSDSNMPLVAVLMGSDSDYEVMRSCFERLDTFRIPYGLAGLSAHRLPRELVEFVRQSDDHGIEVYIAAASMSAALPGAVAALTMRPVIGIPLVAPPHQGLDSLLSIVQMPPGVPVATVTVGERGPENAAILAAQILAISHPEVRAALESWYGVRRREAWDKSNNVLKFDLQRRGLTDPT